MGNCNIAMGSPPLADGEWRTSTRNVVTTTEGATEKIRFGIHRIAKTMKPGKHQDRFSFLMREEKTTNIDGDVVTSRSHRSGGAFAVGVYDGHGESPNAADFCAEVLLDRIFQQHAAATSVTTPPAEGVSSLLQNAVSAGRSEGETASLEEMRKAVNPARRASLKRDICLAKLHATESFGFDDEIPSRRSSFDEDDVFEDFRVALQPFLRKEKAVEGDVLMQQGEPGTDMIFLSEGKVGITVDDTLVRLEGGGEIIGEIALLRTTVRTATVMVRSEEVEYLRLSRHDWEAVLAKDVRFEAVRRHLSDLADDRLGCTAFLERLHSPVSSASSPPHSPASSGLVRWPTSVTAPALRSFNSIDEDSSPTLSPSSYELQSRRSSSFDLSASEFPRPSDAAISSAFVGADADIREKWPTLRTGTTATVLILSPRSSKQRGGQKARSSSDGGGKEDVWDLTVAWAGDSSAMVILPSSPDSDEAGGATTATANNTKKTQKTQKTTKPRLSTDFVNLTREHHVTSPHERARILRAGSVERRLSAGRDIDTTTISKRKSKRSNGNGQQITGPEAILNTASGVSLMVSRSLGDGYGSPAIIPHPQVTRPRIAASGGPHGDSHGNSGVPGGSRLILASDGLWDMVSRADASTFARGVPHPPLAAKVLAEIAHQRWSKKGRFDDIVVIVIDLL